MTSEHIIKKEEKTILILLLNEGLDVWKPVKAIEVETSVFKIISENKHPDDEHWEFNYHDLVKCKEKTLNDGTQSLVAIAKHI